jgi:ATPase subunit of ABC transporter with duplicated ATPase domains
MIVAHDVELRAGARILLEHATFRVGPGDRVGLVGRNGAGKTTLTRVLAGEGQAAGGKVTRSGEVGYLPQDPRTGDLEVFARDRVLSARGLDVVLRRMRAAELSMASPDDARREQAMTRYGRLEAEFVAQGGYTAESEAATTCRRGCSASRWARCPAASGGASSWPGSCFRVRRPCCSTSPPTTSTPTHSLGYGTSCGRGRGAWW